MPYGKNKILDKLFVVPQYAIRHTIYERRATINMQNKSNSKTEDRKQKLVRHQCGGKEDSKIMAKDTPNVFDNCRESSTNRPFLCKTKPISEKVK